MERHDAYAMIGMAFPEIEAPGIRARMKGSLDRTLGVNPVRSRAPHGTAIQPGEGVFPVNETQLHLPKGCIIVWRT